KRSRGRRAAMLTAGRIRDAGEARWVTAWWSTSICARATPGAWRSRPRCSRCATTTSSTSSTRRLPTICDPRSKRPCAAARRRRSRSSTSDRQVTIVVVGASLAGLRAVDELRCRGYSGVITVVGAEPHLPYDRPPLSKQVLAGDWDTDRLAPPVSTDGGIEGLRVDWRLGARAEALDVAGRTVVLADGDRLPYQGLVIATGARPRRLPGTDGLAGVHTLRTLDDALAIRRELDEGAQRVVVVGAGFIGAEVAATCRQRGAAVT